MSDPTREDILNEFPKLVAAAEADYQIWSKGQYPLNKKFTVEVGSKYAKIVVEDTHPMGGGQRSSYGYIVMGTTTVKGKTFLPGDLLKAASWKAPALNFSRGNIFDIPKAVAGGHIRWTGLN